MTAVRSTTETLSEMRARWAADEASQAVINSFVEYALGVGHDLSTVKAAIVNVAADQQAAYPQYDGYWDGPEWVLARITRRMRTKGGVRFERGDVVLVNLTEREPMFPGDVVNPTAYSVRGAINVSTPTTYFKLV